uniref:Multidrug resistance-associated protein 1 n=1 Tax=Ciona savignyi TaxID=51511 RepID=H2Z8F8_CIOSA
LNSTSMIFSSCFQQLVFDLIPCAFLWVSALPYYFYTRRSRVSHIPISALFKAKVVSLLNAVQYSTSVGLVESLNYCVSTVTSSIIGKASENISQALALLFTQFDRMKGVRSSGLLTCYWLLTLLTGVFIFQSKVLLLLSSDVSTDGQILRCVTFFLSFVALLINFVLCFFADNMPAFKPKNAESPEVAATFLSKISFWWFTRMVVMGYKRPIINDDLWKLNEDDESKNIAKSFLKNWNAEKAKVQSTKTSNTYKEQNNRDDEVFIEQPQSNYITSLGLAMVKTFGPYFLFSTVLKVFHDLLSFVSPQLLKGLITFTATENAPMWQGYLLGVGMFVSAILQSVILQQYFHICFVVGMRLRSAIISSIYRKSLLLSNAARKESTVGEVVNLMSVDAQRFMDLMSYLNIVWSGPFQIILALYFLWNILGPSVLAGLAVMVLLIPVNGVIAAKARALQVKQMKYKDERIKLMNEILNGMKVLKMYAWEMSFKDKVTSIRNKELKELRKAAYLNAASSFTFVCAPFLVSLTTFAVYVLSDEKNVLDAQKAFVSLSLFNILRFPLMMLPMVVTSLVQASVSLQRLESFLNNEELDQFNVDHSAASENAIRVDGASFRWDQDEEEDVLQNISMTVPEGSLVAIVGQVGCGKSSLVSAMLGDMEKVTGSVSVKGSVAYVPQQPWIQNLTVRDNITFGKDLNICKYQDTVEACELKSDFEMLPASDQTEIGERTRILVTHGLAFLPQVDKIFVLVNGRITEVGDYYELIEKNGAFAEFLRNYAVSEEDDQFKEGDPTDLDLNEIPAEDARKKFVRQQSRQSMGQFVHGPSCKYVALKKKMKEEKTCQLPPEKKEKNKLIESEKAETGNVKLSVFLSYMSSIGFFLCFLICMFFIVQNAAQVYANIWLSDWSNDELNPDGTQNGTEIRLAVYGSLGFIQALFVMASSFTLTYGSVAAAAMLHYNMLDRIFHAPMSYFDTTPLGRVINRFSKDVYLVDEVIPRTLNAFISTFIKAVATFGVIIYSTPIFSAIVVPLLLLYYFVQRFYVSTSRQLKRLESISRSPIYSHFSETITGASTIRAYGLQNSFIKQSENLVDVNQMAYFPNIVSNRWLALRLELVGNFIVLFAAIFAVAGKGTIDSGIVGLSVSYAMQITQTLNWMVRQSSELETNIVAVERVEEYSNVVQEVLFWERPNKDWPSVGEIKFEDYSTRYRSELDLVVKNINADIKGGEKIGIVGRTGAGKSSLTLALFRIIESVEGCITIDGLNISKIGLQDLRSKLSIIPQDPVLFSGTLRMNLDPFDSYTDEELWNALKHSHLKDFVLGLTLKLEHEVSEGGENLSVGQRQLVCLARALLRKSKILVLDEATAAVDLETDDLIQATIRVQFEDCTTFTIAHRLNTIMDSTRVLVLDAGKVAEFDSPINLLKAKGIFYSMAKDAGLA